MRIRLAAAIVVLATQSGLAVADVDKLSGAPLPAPQKPERSSPIHDHFYILGAFYSPSITTSVRYDPTTGVPAGTLGTPVNAERDLGLREPSVGGRHPEIAGQRDLGAASPGDPPSQRSSIPGSSTTGMRSCTAAMVSFG